MVNLINLSMYKFTLEITYVLVISKVWSYLGSTLEFNMNKYLISWLVFILIISMTKNLNMKRNVHFALYVLLLISCIPGISIYGLKNIDTVGFIYFCAYWILMVISFYFVDMFKLNFKKVNIGKNKKIISVGILSIFAIATIYVSAKYTGFRINLTLEVDILREARMYMREIQIPTIFNYLLPMAATIIFPLFAMKYIEEKKFLKFIIVLMLTIVAFSIKGMKSWLINVLISIAIYNTFKKHNPSKIKNILVYCLIICVLLGNVLFLILGNIEISSLISYRTLFLPCEINFDYYNFFSTNEALYLRESIMRSLWESPYSRPVSFIIGELATGVSENNANNGLFGDAFSNFKQIGIICYPFFIAIIFKITDSLGKKFNQNILKGLILCIVWGSINVSFFTWLLTGGVILTWLLLILMSDIPTEN